MIGTVAFVAAVVGLIACDVWQTRELERRRHQLEAAQEVLSATVQDLVDLRRVVDYSLGDLVPGVAPHDVLAAQLGRSRTNITITKEAA